MMKIKHHTVTMNHRWKRDAHTQKLAAADERPQLPDDSQLHHVFRLQIDGAAAAQLGLRFRTQ